MKKIITTLILLVSIIFLGSCTSNSNSVDNKSLDKKISKEWLNNVEFEEEAINEYTENKPHYEIYLPKDINSSLKLICL